jgi:hypothetical protein
MDKQPMNTLPMNARFRGFDGRRYVVTTPASQHPDGSVTVIDIDGGGGGFFEASRAGLEVEVLP